MSLTTAEIGKARRMQAGERSYDNIAIALDTTADEVRDALTPGWREQGCRYGRHAKRAAALSIEKARQAFVRECAREGLA